jgi:hypothetical protein
LLECDGSYAALKYNTAIAALMKYVNFLDTRQNITRDELQTFLLLLAPFYVKLSSSPLDKGLEQGYACSCELLDSAGEWLLARLKREQHQTEPGDL